MEGNYKFIDISSLRNDKSNTANGDINYPLDKNDWKREGIGMHPGDIGMFKIYEAIYKNIKKRY